MGLYLQTWCRLSQNNYSQTTPGYDQSRELGTLDLKASTLNELHSLARLFTQSEATRKNTEFSREELNIKHPSSQALYMYFNTRCLIRSLTLGVIPPTGPRWYTIGAKAVKL